jgi:hypothetical protein
MTMRVSKSIDRSGEQGVALVMALLMVLAISVLTSSLVMVARSEAVSSTNYTSMSQVRYGAESGIHAAANYLMFIYALPTAASATDPLANFDMSGSPVRWNGRPVVLSSDPAVGSNYPVPAVINAFAANSVGNLNVSVTPGVVAGAGALNVAHSARATLMSMSTVTDYYTNQPMTIQTWQIVGLGRITGSGASLVEVEATIERQPVPVFAYAAFATHNGCSALNFAGGATTASYDSAALVGGAAVVSNTGGNVGTNGNLDGNGGPTTINGTLSTPRSGVGNCTANNVTAATLSGWGTVEEGLVTLPQPINLSTPPDPNPPTTNITFNAGGCPAGAPAECAASPGGSTITPAVTVPPGGTVIQMGNVSMNGSAVVHLNAGIYEVNSLSVTGNATIVVDSGPVVIKVKGDGVATPIDLEGGGVSNPSLNPQMLQFVYGGTGDIKITGGTDTAALVYAPNASASLSGASTNFYGAIITNKITSTGGFSLFYDRRLQRTVMTAGNPTMTSFTWRTF